MARDRKPWRRAGRPGWYAWVDRKLVCLTVDDDRDKAQRALYRLLVSEGRITPQADTLTVEQVVDLYLEHAQKVHRATTFALERHYLQRAVDAFGKTLVTKLRKSVVDEWLSASKLSASTRRIMLTSLRRAVKWARDDGLITGTDCLQKVKTPRGGRRERTLAPEERARFLAAAPPALKAYLFALTETGARPHVIAGLEAHHIDWEARTATHTSKGRPYTLIITEPLLELLRALAGKHPTGPLFRSTRGLPWSTNRLRCAFRYLRAKTGISGVTAYTYRHSFATDALERGLNAAVVGALLNHRDLDMISKHYGHLADRRATLRVAAEQAAQAGRGKATD